MKKRNLIGSRVMQSRRAQGMTRKELCRELRTFGINLNVFSLFLLEYRKRLVFDVELFFLAKVLNVSMDWLLGRTEKTSSAP